MLLIVFVRAESLDHVYARRLARARAGQVARLTADYERLRELRLACKLELSERRFPLSCFVSLAREDGWRLRSVSERARILRRLDGKCDHATTRMVLPPDAADLAPLTRACRARVLEGRKIRAYREEDWSGS